MMSFSLGISSQKESEKIPYCRDPLIEDPSDHLTLFSRKIGSEKILEAISHLDKQNTIYSVGSGRGAVEKLASNEGFRVICIDPAPFSCFQSAFERCFMEPEYAYLDDVSKMEEDASLFLIAPSPWEIWDIEAVKKHPWKQMMLIVETNGSAGSEELLKWLKPILAGGKSEENYTLKYQALQHELPGPGLFRMQPCHYACVVLEKGYQDQAVIIEKTEYTDSTLDPMTLLKKMGKKI